MEFLDYFDKMQQNNENSTLCVVVDQTPGSQQKKFQIVVRPNYSIKKIVNDISTQSSYPKFELILQPNNSKDDLVYLNDLPDSLLYDIPTFNSSTKNFLVLLPAGEWDGDVKKRFVLPITISSKSSIKHLNIKSNTSNDKHQNSNNNSINMSIEAVVNEPLSSVDTNGAASIMSRDINDELLPMNRVCATDSLNMSPVSDPEQLSDDDLALGASASPTETEPPTNGGGLAFTESQLNNSAARHKYDVINESENDLYDQVLSPANSQLDRFYERKYQVATLPSSTSTNAAKGYVGLVNQAMTCYLNSLLQALYMTPEFRNALYRWESDNDNEAKNIPYQLQKLFLNLQTSQKAAVETTDLTRSFGWDSTEAWQQHDIQELCRVMFDALEHKFKNTKQAHLISNLYEGKMIDYVKCLECQTEKTRADTFLDIPLPVRPFGSNVAYGSIEEALRAFVQPETLDGTNQYFCEKCNKKCDAHKGLKFKNFPYVLTMHLKRFDFDYQTMHRIKLNDKVTFPQSLNLNSFVNATESENLLNLQSSQQLATNTDDCSTADSGSAMEEDNCSSGVVTTASSSQHENDINDEDEGIDMSTSTDLRSVGTSSASKSAAVERLKQDAGPFLYELFAIMIHSGSASGGHYYAYIKEFENNEWFCFNDQSVSPITQEDIQKSFGGGSSSSYYSSVYSSSTNAYMLMYRLVDPKRNEQSMKTPDFPEHIQTLLPKLRVEDEARSSRLGRHATVTDLALPDLLKPRVYFYNPLLKKLKVSRIYVSQSFDVNIVLKSAYLMLNVEQFAPWSRCRLVGYDSSTEEIIQSFENISDPTLTDLRASLNGQLDFLLEFRAEGQEFEVYEKGGATWYVYMVNLSTMEMDGPFFVYSMALEQNDVLRHSIAMRLHVKDDEVLLATIRGSTKKAFVAYDPQPTKEAQDHLQAVVNAQFKHLTYFYLNVPNTDAASFEIMGIPSFEIQTTTTPPAEIVSSDVVDAVLMNSTPAANTLTTIGDGVENMQNTYNRESPLPPPLTESNSEDSSLSDGDRTLVDSLQTRGGGDSQVSSTSHSPQLSSPEDEDASLDSYMRVVNAYYNGFGENSTGAMPNNSLSSQFFCANKIDTVDVTPTTQTATSADGSLSDDEAALRKPIKAYKLLVSSHMKMGVFKRHIETLIRVPGNYFNLQRKHDAAMSNNPTNSIVFLNEGETLTVELGKVLQPDEHKARIYFMRLSDLDNNTGKLPCVCEWVYTSTTTAEMAKRDLVAKLHRIDPKYHTLSLDNIRLWLKGGRSPIKIFNNEEILCSDVRSTITAEYLIQECEDGIKPQTDEDSLTIFVRRWDPDKLQFDKFQEITLDKDSEIRNVLSKITDISEENIAYTKINSTFPCTNISVLSVNGSMSWFSINATLDKYPLTTTLTGHVYFYKDVTKTPKELTAEERREISVKEKSRLDRLGCISTSRFSPRRERALKIYLDSPQTPTTITASAPMDANSPRASDE